MKCLFNKSMQTGLGAVACELKTQACNQRVMLNSNIWGKRGWLTSQSYGSVLDPVLFNIFVNDNLTENKQHFNDICR